MHRRTWWSLLSLHLPLLQCLEPLLARCVLLAPPLLVRNLPRCLLTLLLLLKALLLLLELLLLLLLLLQQLLLLPLLLLRHLATQCLQLLLMAAFLLPQAPNLLLLLRRGAFCQPFGRFGNGGIELPLQRHL